MSVLASCATAGCGHPAEQHRLLIEDFPDLQLIKPSLHECQVPGCRCVQYVNPEWTKEVQA